MNLVTQFDKIESLDLSGDLYFIWDSAKSNAADTLGKGHITIGLNGVEYTKEFKVMTMCGIECTDYSEDAQVFFDSI